MTLPPANPVTGGPGANPRPIRAGKVWAGIGLAVGGHILAIALTIALVTLPVIGSGTAQAVAFAFQLPEFALFLVCLIVGIVQISRGDRGLGIGLLVGWGGFLIVAGGVCVAILVAAASRSGV